MCQQFKWGNVWPVWILIWIYINLSTLVYSHTFQFSSVFLFQQMQFNILPRQGNPHSNRTFPCYLHGRQDPPTCNSPLFLLVKKNPHPNISVNSEPVFRMSDHNLLQVREGFNKTKNGKLSTFGAKPVTGVA